MTIKKLRVKRGLKKNLPALDVGELALTTDESKLYVGHAEGNQGLVTDKELTLVNTEIGKVTTQLAHVKNLQDYEITDRGRSGNVGGFLSFTDDDGHISAYNTLAPLYESEGVKFSFGVVKNWIGADMRMDLARIKELESRGHEVTSHSYTHENYFNELTDEQLEHELKDSVEWLLAQGLNINNFFLPFGFYNKRVKQIAKKYYRSMRISAPGTYRANIFPVESFELKTLWLGEGYGTKDDVSGLMTDTFEYYKYYIDKCNAEKSWLIISTHAPNIADNVGYKNLLLQVVQYAKTKIEILTVNDVLNRIGNIVEVGDFSRSDKTTPHLVMAHNGSVKMDGYPIKANKDNSVTNTSLVTDFEENAITLTKLTNAHVTSSGFPFKNGGHLYTYRLAQKGEDNVFDYQEMFTLAGERWKRAHSSNFNSGWGTWRELSQTKLTHILAKDSVKNEDPANTFQIGLSICELSSAYVNTSNFPGISGGVLKTYRATPGELIEQEFTSFGGRVYKRQSVDNVWRTWTELVTKPNVHLSALNALNCNTPFGTFEIGVTYTAIETVNASGSPTNIGGTLITYKPVNDVSFSWQEYHVVGGGKYKRNFATATTFGNWQTLNNA